MEDNLPLSFDTINENDLSGLTQENNNAYNYDDELSTQGDNSFDNFNSKTDSFDFDDAEDAELILSCEKFESQSNPSRERFKSVSIDHLNCLTNKSLAKSTHSKNQWALNAFNSWKAWRNIQEGNSSTSQATLSDIKVELKDMSKNEISFCMQRFVLEVRKQNGEPYPSETIFELVMALQQYLSFHGRDLKFLTDAEFTPFKNVLDNRMKELSGQGFRVKRNQANIISKEQELLLWDKGLLGGDNPTQLSNTMLYLLGLHFALRAGKEHRNLRRGQYSQFRLMTDNNGLYYLRYTQDISKTFQGGLKDRRKMPKVVDAYSIADESKCVVFLYKKYLSNISSDITETVFI